MLIAIDREAQFRLGEFLQSRVERPSPMERAFSIYDRPASTNQERPSLVFSFYKIEFLSTNCRICRDLACNCDIAVRIGSGWQKRIVNPAKRDGLGDAH
jgi:hypothetical protein